jgi:Flp pilus assembly protein TadG
MKVAIAAVKGSRKGCRGATVVEFAMVLPMFLLLLFGIIEFGRYFFVQHTLQFATREGTRLALVGGTLADANGNPLSRTASIIKKINDNASLAVNPAEISISIFPITATYSDPVGWDVQQDAGVPGAYMRVRTRHTYIFLTPLIGNFFTGAARTIQAEATYRNEQFPD